MHTEVAPSTFAVRAGAGCGVVCILRRLRGVLQRRGHRCWSLLGVGSSPLVAAGCGVVAAGRCWLRGGACRSCCCVLCCASSHCAFALQFRVGLGRVSPTPTAEKTRKNPLFRHGCHGCGSRHGAAIPNPPRHRYSVAFFQISATLFRHGAAMAAI